MDTPGTFTAASATTLPNAKAAAARDPGSPPRTPLVLVVDDNPETQRMYYEVLGDAGYQVAAATIARLARSTGEFESPDLLLLDWVLGQEGRGLQVLQQLLLWPTTGTLPVLVCAGHTTLLAELEAPLRVHGATLIAKPFRRKVLMTTIDLLLSGSRDDDHVPAHPQAGR